MAARDETSAASRRGDGFPARLVAGRSLVGVSFAHSVVVDKRPSADTTQSRTQRSIHSWFAPIIRIRGLMLPLGCLGVGVDMRAFDLFDQQEDRPPGGAKFVVAVGNKADGPGAKLFNLDFVEAIAHVGLRAGVYDCSVHAESGRCRGLVEERQRPRELEGAEARRARPLKTQRNVNRLRLTRAQPAALELLLLDPVRWSERRAA